MRTVDRDAFLQMQERGGQWAAYENKALDSANVGHVQYLKFGAGCTHEVPPEQYPADTSYGLGWRYRYIGVVNFEAGVIEEVPRVS